MQGDEPLFAALGGAQRQDPGLEIDIAALESDRFADAHATSCEKAE